MGLTDPKTCKTIPGSDASTASSGKGVGAAKGMSSATDIQKAIADGIAKYQSAMGSSGGSYYVQKFTPAESDAVVQNTYKQMFGRDAVGSEYQWALNIVESQDKYTSAQGRAQALENVLQGSPEYQSAQQNKWLTAIYNDLQNQIARTKQ
jgi:hypothetical protein